MLKRFLPADKMKENAWNRLVGRTFALSHLDTCLYLKSQWLNGGKSEIKHSDSPNLSMQYLLPTWSLCWWIAHRRFLKPDLCQTPTRFRMTLLGASQRHSLPLFVFSESCWRRNPLCMQFSPVVWQFQNIILQKENDVLVRRLDF